MSASACFDCLLRAFNQWPSAKYRVIVYTALPESDASQTHEPAWRLRGATVARLTPDQKVACSNHVGVISFPWNTSTPKKQVLSKWEWRCPTISHTEERSSAAYTHDGYTTRSLPWTNKAGVKNLRVFKTYAQNTHFDLTSCFGFGIHGMS